MINKKILKLVLFLIFYLLITEYGFSQLIRNIGVKIARDFITTKYENTFTFNDVYFANLPNPSFGKWKSNPNINLGLLADFSINKYFELNPILGYYNKNFKIPFWGNMLGTNHFLYVNLSAKFSPDFKYLNPFFEFGPRITCLLDKKVDLIMGGPSKGIPDLMHRCVLDLTFGLGVDITKIFSFCFEYIPSLSWDVNLPAIPGWPISQFYVRERDKTFSFNLIMYPLRLSTKNK